MQGGVPPHPLPDERLRRKEQRQNGAVDHPQRAVMSNQLAVVGQVSPPQGEFRQPYVAPKVLQLSGTSGSDTPTATNFPKNDHFVALGQNAAVKWDIETNPLCGF
jgi:hypothetical protein